MSELNNRTVVKVSHELNHFRGGYTPLELDFIYSFISCIKNEDREFTEYSLTLQDLEKKLDKRLRLKEIEYIFDSLTQKSFKIDNAEELVVYPFFQRFRYGKEEKIISVKFNEELKPHLLQLNTFAMGSLRYILQLRGEYSKRIYMLLAQWQKVKEVTYEVADLREMLGIPEGYKYSNVKQKAITKAQAELKEKAPFYFEFIELKEGRKVKAIRFKIIFNNRELEAFKTWIKEDHHDKRLYEIDRRILLCNQSGELYYIGEEGEIFTIKGDYGENCWKTLLSKKDVLALEKPTIIGGLFGEEKIHEADS